MNKHNKPTLQKLEQLFRQLDYTVRYEKGTFNSGYCIVDASKIVVIDKFFNTDSRVTVLLDILNDILDDDKDNRSDFVYKRCLSIPCSTNITDEQLKAVCEKIKEVY